MQNYPNHTKAKVIEMIVAGGHTQADVERITGISQQIVSRWLTKHYFNWSRSGWIEVRESKLNFEQYEKKY